jgi:hypothetical protein
MSTSTPLFSFQDRASTRRILGCAASLLLLASTTRALPLVVGDFSVTVSTAVPSSGTPVSDSQTNVPWNTGSSGLLVGPSGAIYSALTYDLDNPDNAASATFLLATDARFSGDARTSAGMTALFSVTEPVMYTISGSFQGFVNRATAGTETLLTDTTPPGSVRYRESEAYRATRSDDAFLFRTNLIDEGNLLTDIEAGSPTGTLVPGVMYRLDLSYRFAPVGVGDTWATGTSAWSVTFDRIGPGGPTHPPGQGVPDSANTASLLGGTLLGMCFLRRWKHFRSSLSRFWLPALLFPLRRRSQTHSALTRGRSLPTGSTHAFPGQER